MHYPPYQEKGRVFPETSPGFSKITVGNIGGNISLNQKIGFTHFGPTTTKNNNIDTNLWKRRCCPPNSHSLFVFIFMFHPYLGQIFLWSAETSLALGHLIWQATHWPNFKARVVQKLTSQWNFLSQLGGSSQDLYTLENSHGTQKWRFGRWFPFSTGWCLGFMLIFGGVSGSYPPWN